MTTRTVSTSEAKAKLSSFVQRVASEREEVVIEKRGTPQAVLISYADYEQFSTWREQERRQKALDELQALANAIQSRNRDLDEATANRLADRFAHEVIEEMIAEGKIRYDAEPK